jgi:hypothetical protein
MNTFGESLTESIGAITGRHQDKIGLMITAHTKQQDNVGLKRKAMELNSRKSGLKDSLLNVDGKGNRLGRHSKRGGTGPDRTMQDTSDNFESPQKVGAVLDGEAVGGGSFFKKKKKRIPDLDLPMGKK